MSEVQGVMGVEELLRDEAAETIRAVCFGVEAKQRFVGVRVLITRDCVCMFVLCGHFRLHQ